VSGVGVPEGGEGSIASRAFAAYYLVQTLLAVQAIFGDRSIKQRTPLLVSYTFLAGALGFIVVFAIPAG